MASLQKGWTVEGGGVRFCKWLKKLISVLMERNTVQFVIKQGLWGQKINGDAEVRNVIKWLEKKDGDLTLLNGENRKNIGGLFLELPSFY